MSHFPAVYVWRAVSRIRKQQDFLPYPPTKSPANGIGTVMLQNDDRLKLR